MSHPTHADGGHDLPHSHQKHYLIVAAVLTVVTAVEIGILFLPAVNGTWWVVPFIGVLAVFKFGLVVGEFMHLRPDHGVYKFLFMSPMFLALFSFIALSALAVVTYQPFGGGYAITQRDRKAGFVPPSAGGGFEVAWPEDKLKAAFAEAEKGGFAKGKATFASTCANCHRGDGGGMPALGPNMTDDCFKHGGSLAELYTTIGKGVQGTAMPAWSTSMSPDAIRQAAFFVRSLKGKNVAGGLECVGTKVAD